QSELYLFDFRPIRPKSQELFKVAWASDHLARHRAMDGDLVAGDALENPLIGGRSSPDVMFGLKAVNRDGDEQVLTTGLATQTTKIREEDAARFPVSAFPWRIWLAAKSGWLVGWMKI